MMRTVFIWLKLKILDRHTGVSPADQSEHRFDEFRSDLSSFYSFINPFHYAKLEWSNNLLYRQSCSIY